MGGAGGGRSPSGSGHVGLERGEVRVSVPEEWVRFSCLPFPRHQPAATSGVVGTSRVEAMPPDSALCPHLSLSVK